MHKCINITTLTTTNATTGLTMTDQTSTATMAVSKAAKKAKTPLEKLQAKYDRLQEKFDDLTIAFDIHFSVRHEDLEKIRILEAQKDIAERKAVSDSHDTKRNSNALILIETYLEDAAEDDEKTVPVSRLARVSEQLTKEFTAPALQIQAH